MTPGSRLIEIKTVKSNIAKTEDNLAKLRTKVSLAKKELEDEIKVLHKHKDKLAKLRQI
jgi:hypothetical protein